MVKAQIGVLALQGGFDPHLRMLRGLGVDALPVLDPQDISRCDALIIPGGESTAIGKLMVRYGLISLIQERSGQRMPIFGTCAGMILLAREILGYEQPGLRLLDIAVERNAYGRQLESFEGEVAWKDGSTSPGVFIRAPRVARVGEKVEILAEREDVPVLVRSAHILAASFHPELTDDTRVHDYFLKMVAEAK